MNRKQPTDGSSGFDLSRRAILKSGASLAIGTAGCAGFDLSQIRTYEFTASPVGLRETPDGMEYETETNFERTIERRSTVSGVGVTITSTSYVSLYESPRDTFELVASPLAKIPVVGDPQNPLADRPMEEILTGEPGERLLQSADVVDEPDLRWERGPKQVARREVQFLGQNTTIRSFAGVIEGEGFTLVTAARSHDAGDVVLATTVLQRDGSATSLIGENGYLTRSEVAESVDRLATLLEYVDRTGVGLHLPESNLIVTDGPGENYVRVVVENEHENKTLYSVGLMTQLFDDRGESLDMQVAGIDRLGPDEVFEGYVPYFSDGAATHVIEGHYTARDVGAETPEDIQVTDDALEEGHVSGVIHNTSAESVPGFTLRVTFYGDGGSVLGSATRQFPGLSEGATEEFEANVDETETISDTQATDYAVELVRYDREPLYVR